MKKSKSLFFLLQFVCFAVAASAQISYSNGKICVNGAPSNSYYTFSANNWSGMYMTCKTNNFLQFDLTPYNPRIAGTGDQVVFYNSQTSTFNGIQVADVYNYSDARAKENIVPLTTGLSNILNLRPISYTWKQQVTDMTSNSSDISATAYGPIECSDKIQYGFLAQEVEEVIPDAVKTDEEGRKMINYIAIIPMLVQAVQELQSTIELQTKKIEELSGGEELKVASHPSNNKIVSCSPNSSNGNVTIITQLEKDITSAILTISSMTGSKEKTLLISSDMPTVSENISSLSPGIHIVSLYVNGLLADSQRIIKE